MSPDNGEIGKRQVEYKVTISTVVPDSYIAGSRSSEEQAAIIAILERVPPEHRNTMREVLLDPDATFTSSADPEIARLLGIIGSIRAADRAHAIAAAQSDRAKDVEDRKTRVRVVVALVPEGDSRIHQTTLVRRPNDGGRPLLLIPESSATEENIEMGLRLAAHSLKNRGPVPTREEQLTVRTARGRIILNRKSAASVSRLDALRTSPFRDIAGYGQLRALDVITRLPGSRSQ